MNKFIGVLTAFLLLACAGDVQQDSASSVSEAEDNLSVEMNTNNVPAEIMEKGKQIYVQCAACHQGNGEGIAGAFPPLAGSDYMLADTERMIKTILNGTQGSIMVNGKEYPGGTMTTFAHLSDEDIAAVATFVLNSWGNSGGIITASKVAASR